ncbi:MAG: hypothetical protein AAFX06_34105, partial [Planctomycetota bacterium]
LTPSFVASILHRISFSLADSRESLSGLTFRGAGTRPSLFHDVLGGNLVATAIENLFGQLGIRAWIDASPRKITYNTILSLSLLG